MCRAARRAPCSTSAAAPASSPGRSHGRAPATSASRSTCATDAAGRGGRIARLRRRRCRFATGAVDVAYCSNVLEHVATAWPMADELVRVTRPGGTVFLSFTPWLLAVGRARDRAVALPRRASAPRDRYARRRGHRPKNDFGRTLFAYRVGRCAALGPPLPTSSSCRPTRATTRGGPGGPRPVPGPARNGDLEPRPGAAPPMTPAHRGRPTRSPTRSDPTEPCERLRLLLICAALISLVFAQSAGNAAADTKLDLVVSPLRFLAGRLRLWDPIGDAGQLQNQAYGYLFPMGPFFAVLHALGMPAWVVQRGVGVGDRRRRLPRHRTGWPGCSAYARSGRRGRGRPGLRAGTAQLSELGSISSELMPVAALPWVLLPLVPAPKPARPGGPRPGRASRCCSPAGSTPPRRWRSCRCPRCGC